MTGDIVISLIAGTSATLVLVIMGVPFAVALGLLVRQQLENHFLQPVIYGRTFKLSPLAVLVSVLIGAELRASSMLWPPSRSPAGSRCWPARASLHRGRQRKLRSQAGLRFVNAPVAQWKSGGLLSRWSEVRILPGA